MGASCNSFCSTKESINQTQPDTEAMTIRSNTGSCRSIGSPNSKSRAASYHRSDSSASISNQSSSIETVPSNIPTRVHSTRTELQIIQGMKEDFKQAVIEGNDTMVMYLHDEHPSMDFFNVTYENGDSPLHSAARKKRYNVIDYLLECGTCPNLTNDDGDTALHIASRLNDMKSIKILHKYGGDGNIKNEHSETAITIAHEMHYDHIVEFLGGLPPATPSVSNTEQFDYDESMDHAPMFAGPSSVKSKSRSKKSSKRSSIGMRGTTQRVNYFADDILSDSVKTMNNTKNEDLLTTMNTARLNDITDDIFTDIQCTIQDSKMGLMELSGWMEKKQSSPPYSWLKRWVIVDYGYLLWSDRQITIGPKGVNKNEKKRWNKCIPITNIEEVTKVKEGKTQRKFKIKVNGNGINREYLFKAQSKKWRDKWVKDLSKHVKILHQESIYVSSSNTRRLI